jgi:hypothetical protein
MINNHKIGNDMLTTHLSSCLSTSDSAALALANDAIARQSSLLRLPALSQDDSLRSRGQNIGQ